MFNSQKINNDPFPYVSSSGSRHANPGWMGSEYFSNRRERPEFDNNPNPILIAFREEDELQRDSGDEGIPTLGTARYWIDTNQMGNETTEEEFTHAYKVLTRLVNIYGSEQ